MRWCEGAEVQWCRGAGMIGCRVQVCMERWWECEGGGVQRCWARRRGWRYGWGRSRGRGGGGVIMWVRGC